MVVVLKRPISAAANFTPDPGVVPVCARISAILGSFSKIQKATGRVFRGKSYKFETQTEKSLLSS